MITTTQYRNTKTGEVATQLPVMQMGDYKEIHARYSDKLKDGCEVTEEFYDDQLEVLPPEYYHDGVFAVGEASTHKNGVPIYHCFAKYKERYYFIGLNDLKTLDGLYGNKVRTATTMRILFNIL